MLTTQDFKELLRAIRTIKENYPCPQQKKDEFERLEGNLKEVVEELIDLENKQQRNAMIAVKLNCYENKFWI